MMKTFKLSVWGYEDSDEFDCTGLTEEEIERELVNWVLERVDHWIEEGKQS
ncbi:hypothetical protein [Paenibacillus alvei]|uniref:Uncharacterized protein n=1 Tax=Paenibacillus alvei TaxID=44250 RepID=A0A383RC13_PAEAL|nr:hypothetical protein [Paenibacillus alvei]SYX84637.1 conserved protein of unknown function [Paenibacillus alvei]